MNPRQANGLIKRLLGGFPTQRMKMSTEDIEAMTVAYTAGLIDLEYRAAEAAVDRACKTAEWIPTVARIRAELGEIAHGDVQTGAEAWGRVLRAIRERGSWRTPGVEFDFADPVTRDVVRALGWPELCAADQKGLVANRARFIEAYEEIIRQGRKNAQASHGAVAPKLQLSSRAAPTRQLETRRNSVLALKEIVPEITPAEDADGESGEES